MNRKKLVKTLNEILKEEEPSSFDRAMYYLYRYLNDPEIEELMKKIKEVK